MPLPPASGLGVEIPCRLYRPRDPRKTPLFGLLDSLYERVKGTWEERFEGSYGFWRGLVDEVVARYLDCGISAELAAFLQDEVVEEVGHAQWVFTIPKMLRVYFLHHRELLGALSLAGYETVKELMAAAAVEEKDFRPGVVSVVQTFGAGPTRRRGARPLAKLRSRRGLVILGPV